MWTNKTFIHDKDRIDGSLKCLKHMCFNKVKFKWPIKFAGGIKEQK